MTTNADLILKRCPCCGVIHQPKPYKVKARNYVCTPCQMKRDRAWRMRVPIPLAKRQARTAVLTALRSGRLIRQPCVICGKVKTEAHHGDYARPLDVEWLCGFHHRVTKHGRAA